MRIDLVGVDLVRIDLVGVPRLYSTVLFPCSPAPNTKECDVSCERSEEVADTG